MQQVTSELSTINQNIGATLVITVECICVLERSVFRGEFLHLSWLALALIWSQRFVYITGLQIGVKKRHFVTNWLWTCPTAANQLPPQARHYHPVPRQVRFKIICIVLFTIQSLQSNFTGNYVSKIDL